MANRSFLADAFFVFVALYEEINAVYSVHKETQKVNFH